MQPRIVEIQILKTTVDPTGQVYHELKIKNTSNEQYTTVPITEDQLNRLIEKECPTIIDTPSENELSYISRMMQYIGLQ